MRDQSIRSNQILNYLGFVLQSHSLFYCSVPKVATRTFLKLITYLHVRDELIRLIKKNFTDPLPNLHPTLQPLTESNSFKKSYLERLLFPNLQVMESLF